MRTPLEQQVLDAIHQSQIIVPGDRVAVAVSGGADSVALFRLLVALRNVMGISLLVVHFDHTLRGAESESDAQFVAALACEHHVEFIGGREDVASAAKQQRLNLEDAARRLRYEFFHRIVERDRATRIAVAHTADDQAETVLARLFRGTGPAGLSGIHPVVGPIVRPLLGVRRADLHQYLAGLGQPWREDSTNLDVRRQRARIRAQLLPVLENDFSSSIVNHLSGLARLSREEQAFWQALVEDRFRAHVHERDGKLTIRISDLISPLHLSSDPARDLDLHDTRDENLVGSSHRSIGLRPLTERLIRRLYERVRGDCRDLTAVHVEQTIYLASESASGHRVELPGGVVVQRNFDDLVFSRKPGAACAGKSPETKRPARAYNHVVHLPEHGVAAISIPELGSRLLLKVIDWPSMERDTKHVDALDAALLRGPLTLRNWQPGDAYRPRGHRQARKLKQLFLTHRVPRSERPYWPVIECRGSIVWARGMPSANDFCVREHSRAAVLIEEAGL